MRRLASTIMILALCAGCSQRERDLEQARTARSVLAEWALLAGMRGALPDIYVRQMRAAAQQELSRVVASTRAAGSPASLRIAAVADLGGDPPAAVLQARMRAARAIEQSLEAR